MKTKYYVRFGILSVVFLVFVQSGIAALDDDPCAIVKDSVSFSSGLMNGHVDYAVYAPGQYDGSISFKNLYVYAYQVFNESPSVGIDYFSVVRCPSVLVPNALYDPDMEQAAAGGSIPTLSLVLQESVLFVFQFDNISPNEHSCTLLFASDSGPSMGTGLLGGSPGIVSIPTPIPEPATIGLVIGGAFMALRRRRKV